MNFFALEYHICVFCSSKHRILEKLPTSKVYHVNSFTKGIVLSKKYRRVFDVVMLSNKQSNGGYIQKLFTAG